MPGSLHSHGGRLAGRAVVITGGTDGIGLAIASACSAEGGSVVVWGRDPERRAHAVERLHAEGAEAFGLECDVSDESAVEAAFGRSVEMLHGRVDAVFANAATSGVSSPFAEVTFADWRQTMAVNLDGVFFTLRAATRHMLESGGGSLVAVSSTSALFGAARNAAYGASKSALRGLVRALAVELAPNQIRVNALVPGWTRTGLTERLQADDRFVTATLRRTPVGRWAEPQEYGAAAVFLADPTTTFHTGHELVVDGGYTIS